MVASYVLIQTIPGRVGRVAEMLQGIPRVTSVHQVSGPFDVIARVETSSLDDVVSQIRRVDGSLRVLRCEVNE